jgi:hypothetical protein
LGSKEFTSIVIPITVCGKAYGFNLDKLKEHWRTVFPDYFVRASFGALSFNPQNNIILDKEAIVGCSGRDYNGASWTAYGICDAAARDGIEFAAETYVVTKFNIPLDSYTYRIFLLPPGISCTAAGSAFWGTFGCNNYRNSPQRVTWYGPYVGSDGDQTIIIHELGHTFGLDHSLAMDKYGSIKSTDMSDPMGGAWNMPVHYNAILSINLGWTRPVIVLTANTMPIRIWLTYTVHALAGIQTSTVLVYPGTWMNGKDGWGDHSIFTVSFRHGSSLTTDAGLDSSVKNKVFIHSQAGSCQVTVVIGVLDTFNTYWPLANAPNAGPSTATASPLLHVRLKSIDVDKGSAIILICRGC